MKNIFYTIILLLAGVSLYSCSEDQIKTYNGIKSGLMIQEVYSTDIYGNPIEYRDSASYSFAGLEDDTKTLKARVYVKTIGGLVDYDRPYVMKIDAAGTTGVVNEDYSLDGNKFIIKAGQAADTVLVTLNRSAKLHSKTIRVTVRLEANDYFDLPIAEYKNSSAWNVDGKQNSAVSYLIKFDEKYKEPSYWDWFGNDYFGKFSATKYVTLNAVMGWKLSDWNYAGSSGAKIALGKFDFAARTLRDYLQKMANAGTPVLEDDGSYVQLADGYKVDYSHIGSNK